MARRVIELEGVGKRYRLGEHHGDGHGPSRDARRARRRLAGAADERGARALVAARRVVPRRAKASALGIIGRTAPARARCSRSCQQHHRRRPRACPALRGRVGSLLEVGTGFHGELTGRENIYLNGAILGMTQREVERAFDEIVEFAELERFIDTPVKRYSSGMYLRLGFAIAAHLEPEILLVDEVLAVGDAEFQRKCLGQDERGRTRAVARSSSSATTWRRWPGSARVDLAGQGPRPASGPTEHVVDEYMHRPQPRRLRESIAIDPSSPPQVVGVALVDEEGVPQSTLTTRSSSWIQVDVVANEPPPTLDVTCQVATRGGTGILDEALSDVEAGALSRPGRLPCPVRPATDLDPRRVHDQRLASDPPTSASTSTRTRRVHRRRRRSRGCVA